MCTYIWDSMSSEVKFGGGGDEKEYKYNPSGSVMMTTWIMNMSYYP